MQSRGRGIPHRGGWCTTTGADDSPPHRGWHTTPGTVAYHPWGVVVHYSWGGWLATPKGDGIASRGVWYTTQGVVACYPWEG